MVCGAELFTGNVALVATAVRLFLHWAAYMQTRPCAVQKLLMLPVNTKKAPAFMLLCGPCTQNLHHCCLFE